MKNAKSRRATDPFAIRVKFEQTRLKKAIKHARETPKASKSGKYGHGGPPHGSDGTTAMARGIFEDVFNEIRRLVWCHDAEQALDNGIKFLQDYGDQLTAKQKEDYRKGLADLLDTYSDIC